MNRFQKKILFVLPFLCMMGCGKDVTPSKPAATVQPTASASSTPNENQNELAQKDYEDKLKLVEDDGAHFGMNYLGFLDTNNGVHLEDLIMKDQFEASIDQDHIVTLEPNEAYAFLPNPNVKTIEIYQNTWLDDKDENKLVETFHDAKPFIIVGNQSELRPDIFIKLIYEDGSTVSFSPYVSLKDGHIHVDSKDENLKWEDLTNKILN